MNKHSLILGLLGLQVLEAHTNVMGKNPHVRLTEEQLDVLEAALQANDISALEKTISDHEATIATHVENEASVATALTAAFEENALEATGETSAEQIAHLSAKCKEFGSKTNMHSIPPTDGKDKTDEDALQNGFYDPTAPHNQQN